MSTASIVIVLNTSDSRSTCLDEGFQEHRKALPWLILCSQVWSVNVGSEAAKGVGWGWRGQRALDSGNQAKPALWDRTCDLMI